ncbi:MAG: acyltransferase [Halobacteriovoraceae bacterium]|nr:acyltransferase [Halobacteriovoraceae bacterium]
MDKAKDYRPDIDGLRAIAVISVLLFHLDISYFEGGFVGVDIFLVISGYLITKLIWKEISTTNSFSFKHFYSRRIKRLFPALFATLFFTALAGVIFLSPTHLQRFGGALSSSLLSFSNMYFWIEGDYFDFSTKLKPLLHTWSLSLEEQFYLFWPTTLFLFFYLSKRKVKTFIALLSLLGILSLILNFPFSDGHVEFLNTYLPKIGNYFSNGKATIFYLLPFRVFEFTIGALLVWLSTEKFTKIHFDFLFIVGILLSFYSIITFNENLIFPTYNALFPCMGAACLILSGNKSRFQPILSNSLMIPIGLISYSLYLVHWPIIVFALYLNHSLSSIQKLLIVLASLLIAALFYKFIEQPFRRKKKKLSFWLILYFAFSLPLIVLGYKFKHEEGWPWRIPSFAAINLEKNQFLFHKKYYGGAGYPTYGPVETKLPADIVLMGDSHARHYAEGIYKEWAKPQGLNLYIAAGTSCFHLPRFTRTTKGTDWNQLCPQRLQKALQFLKNSTATRPILVISHSWLEQLKVAALLSPQKNSIEKKTLDIQDIFQGLRELKALVGKSVKIIVIGQVPTTDGKNLYDLFTRPRFIPYFNENIDELVYTHSLQSYVDFNHSLKEFSEQTNDFTFLDPFEALCHANKCNNLNSEKRLIYSDTSHLSKYGSIEVIHYFLKKLQ